jgi:hypothetical protein
VRRSSSNSLFECFLVFFFLLLAGVNSSNFDFFLIFLTLSKSSSIFCTDDFGIDVDLKDDLEGDLFFLILVVVALISGIFYFFLIFSSVS